MATSRTGTAKWKRDRKRALREFQEAGLLKCPWCGVRLDYSQGRKPNSAEPDHIKPHSQGGADSEENYAVLCRSCNISKRDRAEPKASRRGKNKTLSVTRSWFSG